MTVQQMINPSAAEMAKVVEQQRLAYVREGKVAAEVRMERLDRLITLVHDHKDEFALAMSADFGHRSTHQSLMADIYSTLETLKHTKKQIAKWMKPEKRKAPFPMGLFGAKARIEYQPKGVVGVLGTWNFPISTVIGPLCGILAAGNRAVIKYSEVTPASAELMDQLFKRYFKRDEVAGFLGGAEIGAAFSALPLDHLIFTGATGIGRHVLRAAAENLTPVTLELGGKSPVIISSAADIEESAKRIMTGKALNVGQVCLSPDYVLVPEDLKERFIDALVEQVKTMFPSMLNNPDYTSVINPRHQQRLLSYLEDARVKGGDVREINPANEDFSQQKGVQKIPMTLVVDPSDEMLVMQEEMFGPLLCIKSYQQIEQAISYINSRPRPLALYYFGDKNGQEVRKVLDSTCSGGVTINDVLVHVSCEDLPFGGIGPSGMGSYHGIEGFKTFSHARSVYTQTKINLQALGGMIPPYGDKCDKTLKGMIKK
ncbi:coniferyl-aldehyde dehydrogenase [Sinobacterium caligoides]|uniref:Aldehyde dehydrogenase n=1 Tax=Sinobacterium caligoides TaxID=933926 RepID=A0A3N2DH04_9GAMM|nr:coniferyl aldehyde dehydrogenase [Sinobacterium caligoides]ROR99052.1 coniferyl-aldehyde dehydrogenase [Sinobacterium caligoides]